MEINMSKRYLSEDVPKALVEFMGEMNAWEIEFFYKRKQALGKGIDDPRLKEEYRQKLELILKGYVIEDKFNYGRLIDLGCAKPATYDPDVDEIDILGGDEKSLVLHVQQVRGAGITSKIYMVMKEGKWKVKKKEILSFDERWRRAPL
ncbi:NTF2 fold immunity protein [Pseudomonas sp. SMSB3]|uniref:NTF2 fold immunity protein n=1 Tax=Pseudomonas sp. SMSB3 TaxID=3390196 RepID=UPI003F849A67